MRETMIRVWRFHDAPVDFQRLSTNGGDEDWLALVPPTIDPGDISWAWSGTGFGVCDVDQYKLQDGSTVLIGCHS